MGNMMGRGVLLVFCAIFAVVFGAGGYWAGLRPLAETAQAAWTVRSWQPVPAQVLDVQLKQHAGSEGGTTYQVLARYRYTVAGQTYEAQRVGLDPNSRAETWATGRRNGTAPCAKRRSGVNSSPPGSTHKPRPKLYWTAASAGGCKFFGCRLPWCSPASG